MKTLPTSDQCLMLLRKHGCSDEVIDHCLAVRDLAVAIARKAHADVPLVEVGALLHDIGRCTTHGIAHGVEGGRIARKLGLPESLVLIIERHVGAGIPKSEASKHGLPVQDFLPQTLEEKIVCHADNLIDGTIRQRLATAVNHMKKQRLFWVAKMMKNLHQELSHICTIDLDKIEVVQKK